MYVFLVRTKSRQYCVISNEKSPYLTSLAVVSYDLLLGATEKHRDNCVVFLPRFTPRSSSTQVCMEDHLKHWKSEKHTIYEQ